MDGDSSRWVALAVAGAALLGLMILSATEGALATISRARLKELQEKGSGGAGSALALLDNDTLRLSMRSLNRILVAILLGAAALWGLQALAVALLAALLLPTLATALGVRWYHSVAPAMAPLVQVSMFVIAPIQAVLGRVGRSVAGKETVRDDEREIRQDEEERRAIAAVAGERPESIAEEGREMIQSIVSLGHTTARELMVPRPDIFALPDTLTVREALEQVIAEGHSRTPVYNGTIDNIVGILYAKDLLPILRDGASDQLITGVLRPALFVPESRHADGLLNDLQSSRVHLAIIFDEYGGTAGLVTIEDVLEEIVGEIQDEYDAEEATFSRIEEDTAVVSGLLDIDDLNDEMDLKLPTDTNDTVGGLIYSALGRIPIVGDEVWIEPGGVSFQVIAMAERRIARVRVRRLPAMPDTPPADTDVPSPIKGLDQLRAMLF